MRVTFTHQRRVSQSETSTASPLPPHLSGAILPPRADVAQLVEQRFRNSLSGFVPDLTHVTSCKLSWANQDFTQSGLMTQFVPSLLKKRVRVSKGSIKNLMPSTFATF
jgi:hypothetical protein